MDAELEKMIREVHDKQAIYEVIMRYSRGVDRQDKDIVVSCYHADGVDDHGMCVAGAADFFDWTFPSHLKWYKRHQHMLGNHLCTAYEGNTAHTETYYMFIGATDPDEQVFMSGGRYLDRLEKRNGQWKIAARKCLVEWTSTGPQQGEWAEAFALVGTSSRDRKDSSYDRPLTVDPKRVGIRKGV